MDSLTPVIERYRRFKNGGLKYSQSSLLLLDWPSLQKHLPVMSTLKNDHQYTLCLTITCSKIVDILLDFVSKLPIVRKFLRRFQNYPEKSSEKLIK